MLNETYTNIDEMLEKFPKLKSYIDEFRQNKTPTGKISKLCFFFKYFIEEGIVEIQDLTDWDDEMVEEFESWGHNSRYANIFEPDLYEYLDDMYIERAIALDEDYVQEYGEELDITKPEILGGYNA